MATSSENVLITGGAGFIGSRLAARFARDGHNVTVLDSLHPQIHGENPLENSEAVRDLQKVAKLVVGTVTSMEDIAGALADSTLVVHLAAETGTGQSMYEVARYVDVNVQGTANLLDLLVNTDHRVKRVVVASSRSVYGEGSYRAPDGRIVHPPHRSETDLDARRFEVRGADGEELEMVPTDEKALLHPSSVYGITKQMQEALIATVAPSIGLDSVVLRYQNVYGPGQSLSNPYTGILSIFSSLIREGKKINVFEDGLESRDFVFVDDVVEATYLAAVAPDAKNVVLNVGSGEATNVIQVVEALAAALDLEVDWEVSGNYRLGDIRHNVADVSALASVTGFTPSTTFSEGVKRFADWVTAQPVPTSTFEASVEEMAARRLLR